MKSGLDKKLGITFEVNAYQADLLILLFQLLDDEIPFEEISNIESTDILISELWDKIIPIKEFIEDGIGAEVSGHMKDFANLIHIKERT